MKQSKKSVLERMYDEIIRQGGPKGPISKQIVEAFEGTKQFKQRENKIIIQFKRRSPWSNTK
jgi:hypothetical protein